MRVLGIDPSLSNFGLAVGTIDLESDQFYLGELKLQESSASKQKGVRKNSDDLERARSLYKALKVGVNWADIIIVEIPVGSQSARAMCSYGICIGLLASIEKPLIQVTPAEVKLAATGTKTATKQQMIDWATNKYPSEHWLTRKVKGVTSYVAKNEHLADAIAAIEAGLKTDQYKLAKQVFKGNT